MQPRREASEILTLLSQPRGGRESHKAVLNRLTALLNSVGSRCRTLETPIKLLRVEDLWQERYRHVHSDEMDTLRLARQEQLLKEAIHARALLSVDLQRGEGQLELAFKNGGIRLLDAHDGFFRGPGSPLDSPS